MNQRAYEAGKAAYRRGDIQGAVEALSQAKQDGEVSGAVDHLLGNCLMKLGRFADAAAAYGHALEDASYGNSGALACNRGRALLAAGHLQEAIESLTLATKDSTYATPYKANVALGNAQLKAGNLREAGVAFRNAAIDETNPDPSGSLRSLGSCFMQMGRPIDAVEAYRTALDFTSPLSDQNQIYADLGLAYVASNRMAEAVDAFNHATADGQLVLSSEAQTAYDAARRATMTSSNSPSDTNAMLAAAGYGTGSFDPLDPLGESGEFMPSPDDTGFFSISEREIVEQDRRDRRAKRKHRGLRRFLTFLLILLIFAGVAGYAYYSGFGWPTQEAVAEGIFQTKADGGDIADYLAGTVSEDAARQYSSILPSSLSGVKVNGVDRSMNESTVMATATLAAGGEQSYRIQMVRDGIGWKVADIEVMYPSQGGTDATLEDAETEAQADAETEAQADAEAEVPAETTPTDEAPAEEAPLEGEGVEGEAAEAEYVEGESGEDTAE